MWLLFASRYNFDPWVFASVREIENEEKLQYFLIYCKSGGWALGVKLKLYAFCDFGVHVQICDPACLSYIHTHTHTALLSAQQTHLSDRL